MPPSKRLKSLTRSSHALAWTVSSFIISLFIVILISRALIRDARRSNKKCNNTKQKVVYYSTVNRRQDGNKGRESGISVKQWRLLLNWTKHVRPDFGAHRSTHATTATDATTTTSAAYKQTWHEFLNWIRTGLAGGIRIRQCASCLPSFLIPHHPEGTERTEDSIVSSSEIQSSKRLDGARWAQAVNSREIRQLSATRRVIKWYTSHTSSSSSNWILKLKNEQKRLAPHALCCLKIRPRPASLQIKLNFWRLKSVITTWTLGYSVALTRLLHCTTSRCSAYLFYWAVAADRWWSHSHSLHFLGSQLYSFKIGSIAAAATTSEDDEIDNNNKIYFENKKGNIFFNEWITTGVVPWQYVRYEIVFFLFSLSGATSAAAVDFESWTTSPKN